MTPHSVASGARLVVRSVSLSIRGICGLETKPHQPEVVSRHVGEDDENGETRGVGLAGKALVHLCPIRLYSIFPPHLRLQQVDRLQLIMPALALALLRIISTIRLSNHSHDFLLGRHLAILSHSHDLRTSFLTLPTTSLTLTFAFLIPR
jgi:hypothetical protein